MKVSNTLVDKLSREKAAVEKNEWYIYLIKEVKEQVQTVQKHIGTMTSDPIDKIRVEQGRLRGIRWVLEKPDKLMDDLLNSLEE